MTSSQIKTRKIKLIPIGNKKYTKQYMNQISEDLCVIGNDVIRLHITNQYTIDEIIKNKNISKGDAIKLLTSELGTSIQNSGYQRLSKLQNTSSNIKTTFNTTIYKTISKNFYDIIRGKMSVPSFRKTTLPIPVSSQYLIENLYKENGKYYVKFPLPNSLKNETIIFELFFGRDRSNNKIIIDRIIDNEYKLSESSFSFDGNDYTFHVTYQQPKEQYTPNPNIIMGIDLGINNPITFFISNIDKQPEQIDINPYIIVNRDKFFNHRKQLQSNLKYTTGGHGRTKKLKKLLDLKSTESNWFTNVNHKLSKNIIDIAVKHNVHTIKMEDLTGINLDPKKYFLRTWKYYQLQEFIKYKANQYGINIMWVNPSLTSLTCNTCKTHNKLNRTKENWSKFICNNIECDDLGKSIDADLNAAKNITELNGDNNKGKKKKLTKVIIEQHEMGI